VVDVPRRPFKLEQERLPAEELARWPAVPRLAVGAYVEVTGKFALRSPHDEANSDGLVVYEAIDTTKTAPPEVAPTAPRPVTLPAVPALPAPAVSPPSPDAGDSIRRANAGHRAYASRQYDAAITEYEAAVKAWDGNHVAWYGLAGARTQRGDHRGAVQAIERCVALVPDQAMYWLLRGRLIYEATLADAREDAARAQSGRADQVMIDRSALDFTPAVQALLVAIQLEPRLWRAHYLLGRIHRDHGDPKAAAERFSEAIAQHTWDAAPYIALAELYRRWQYRDQAVDVAAIGAMAVPSSADVWFELGMAYDDHGRRVEAIAAFTRALDLDPTLEPARFQRGQAYFRAKDFAHARRDLEAFVKAGKTSFEIAQAHHMLAQVKR
jgi:tetratricopeptide (TPR) repeat protein